MKVSDAIRRIMKLKKITQIEMANELGTGQSNLSMRLRSEESMRLDGLMRIANVCGFDVVLVDRDDVRNAFVIGERDSVDLTGSDAALNDRIRSIVKEVLNEQPDGEK